MAKRWIKVIAEAVDKDKDKTSENPESYILPDNVASKVPPTKPNRWGLDDILCRYIKENFKGLCSGTSTPVELEAYQAFQSGTLTYMKKPYTFSDFIKLVCKKLHETNQLIQTIEKTIGTAVPVSPATAVAEAAPIVETVPVVETAPVVEVAPAMAIIPTSSSVSVASSHATLYSLKKGPQTPPETHAAFERTLEQLHIAHQLAFANLKKETAKAVETMKEGYTEALKDLDKEVQKSQQGARPK